MGYLVKIKYNSAENFFMPEENENKNTFPDLKKYTIILQIKKLN